MDIDTMEAGRETDRIIAGRIMKWPYHHKINYCEDSWYEDCDYCGAAGRDTPGKRLNRSGDDPPENGECDTPPPYSTSISAAMEVAEKMREGGHKITLWGNPPCAEETDSAGGPGWRCRVWPYGGVFEKSSYAPTAPLAICRAALKAAGI